MNHEPVGQISHYPQVGYNDPDVQDILQDPLGPEEIERLANLAEHPELADPLIGLLPARKFSLKSEQIMREQARSECRQKEAERQRQTVEQSSGQLSLYVWAT